ncbi:MAG: prolyl oligopeptidase family serine peptidase [Gammaproteobacteria bacterium]
MKRALAILALLVPFAAPAATQPFTSRDLVQLERASDPRLSPDGRHVAYQLRQTDYEANKGANGIWLLDLSQPGAAPRRLTAPGSESNTPRWSSDGRLYFLSTRSGSQQVWRLDLRGGEAEAVTKLALDVGAFRLSPDGRKAAVALEVFPDCATLACTEKRLDQQARSKATGQVYDKLLVRHWDTWKNGTRSQLFLVDLGAPAAEPKWLTRGIDGAPFDGDVPTKPFGGDEEYAFSPDGRQLFLTARIAGRTEAWSTNTDIWRVATDGTGKPENLSAPNPGYDAGPVVSPDGRTLAWRSMKRGGFEADRNRVMLRDLASGAVRELAPDWDRSPNSLAWSSDGGSLYANADDLGQSPLFALDAKTGAVRRLTDAGWVNAFDAGKDHIVYALDTLRSPAQLFSVPAAGGKATQLTRHNEPLLAQRGLGEAEQFAFKGWNDETVYAHVMKPANFKSDRKYPVAFIVHGGPQNSMANHWHYRWNPQTYAGAGYAVVFVDFHGSTGYGQAFTDSISGDWGGKPLEDLQKGWAHALARYKFLDGSRACALGASYGGYMINWIAGTWPGAFKCLVSHDGIFDNRAMAYETEELWFDEWEMGGTPYEKPANYERHNPVNHVAQWRTPMLVIHGGLDYRIPDTQGLAVFTALQRRGIDSRLLYFPNENHWVLKPQNSVQWHDTVQDWLKRWTGGR